MIKKIKTFLARADEYLDAHPRLKNYLSSGTITFVAAFFGAVMLQISAGLPTNLDFAFAASVLGTAFRTAIRALFDYIVVMIKAE